MNHHERRAQRQGLTRKTNWDEVFARLELLVDKGGGMASVRVVRSVDVPNLRSRAEAGDQEAVEWLQLIKKTLTSPQYHAGQRATHCICCKRLLPAERLTGGFLVFTAMDIGPTGSAVVFSFCNDCANKTDAEVIAPFFGATPETLRDKGVIPPADISEQKGMA